MLEVAGPGENLGIYQAGKLIRPPERSNLKQAINAGGERDLLVRDLRYDET